MGRDLPLVFRVLLSVLLVCSAATSRATHVYGADFLYSYINDTTYKLSLIVYGDCSATIMGSLYTSSPQIEIYNNGTYIQTIDLVVENPTGTEVTPVCPSQINNTSCNGGTIPGIRRFIYNGNVILNSKSANWRFHYTGNMGGGPGGTSAGRSTTITNIFNPGNSAVSLDATLDNLNYPSNSSPVYTTIPTPFFCLNRAANFNPGAVDANGDSLSFALVAAITNNLTVNYIPPYTPSQPLQTAPGSFAFDPLNGQLSFKPDQLQRSLVVYTVYEYINGVLVGTSQREMTFVVINTCPNAPTTGIINSASGAIVVDTTSINVCIQQGPFNFQIFPRTPTNNNINITYAGLPVGSAFNIVGNGTSNPQCTFSWNTTGLSSGAYTFFVTYIDDGCPLSSKQTMAYTINIGPEPIIAYSVLNNPTCAKRAGISISPTTGANNWNMDVYSGSTLVHTLSSVSGTVVDSLPPGNYTLHIANAFGCTKDTNVSFVAPPPVGVTAAATRPSCNNSTDGSITVNAMSGLTPFSYSFSGGTPTNTSTFSGLAPGTYTTRAIDANGCYHDTTITLTAPAPVAVSAIVTDATCKAVQDGKVIISASGGTPGYAYSVGTGSFSTTATFSPLATGTYTFHVQDTNSCTKDTTITIVNRFNVTGSINVSNALCYNQASGSITATGANGTSPYTYAINTGIFAAGNTFISRGAGTYNIHIKDANNCTFDTVATVTQPNPVFAQVTITQPTCYGYTDGSYAITANGGTPAYTYAHGTGSFTTSNIISNLASGPDTIHVRDANNCTYDTIIAIGQPTQLRVSDIATDDVKCFGGNSGSITAVATAATPPYNYAIDGGTAQPSGTFTGLVKGTHTIKITDSKGCSIDTNATLQEPPPVLVMVDSIVAPTCEGYKDGSIHLHGTGGTQPYTFANNGGSYILSASFTQLAEGTYTLSVRDNNNCTHDTTVQLKGFPHITITNVDLKQPRCFGLKDGVITVAADGGTPPLAYYLDDKHGNPPIFEGLAADQYPISIKDKNNCQKDTIVSLEQPEALKTTVRTTANNCAGNNDGTVTLIPTGGTVPYAYQWDFDPNLTGDAIGGLDTGTYSAHILDAHACADSITTRVLYNDCCNPFLPDAFTPNGDGKNDVFHLLYKGDLKLKSFAVYDRGGRRVFYSADISKGWDGTYNGVPQDGNVFFYYVLATCGLNDGHEVTLKGDVTLIR